MPIGTLRVSLRIRGVHSLKQKRGVLLPLLARVRNDLRCAAAEVGASTDRWQSAELEIACVNSDRGAAEATLRQVLEVLERGGEVEVVDHHTDVT